MQSFGVVSNNSDKLYIEENYGDQIKEYLERGKKKMNEQFYSLNIGDNKVTIDLSKVRKQGLIYNKGVFGKKAKVVIYYVDRPEKPEINIELNTDDEAKQTYNAILQKLNKWADDANSSKLLRMSEEIDLLREQKELLLSEKDVLMQVFNTFKEMMELVDQEKSTDTLIKTIKSL